MLDAADDLHVLGAGGDRVAGLGERLERRAAEPVDGRAGGGQRQPGHERRGAGDVAAQFPALLGRAEHDVLDRVLGDAAAVDDGPHDGGGQLVAADVAIQPALGVGPADRRAAAGDDDRRGGGIVGWHRFGREGPGTRRRGAGVRS